MSVCLWALESGGVGVGVGEVFWVGGWVDRGELPPGPWWFRGLEG